MTAHTPGPWQFDSDTGKSFMVHNGSDDCSVVCAHIGNKADARLIAHAPALLHALEAICKDSVHWRVGGMEMDHAKALVAQAKGE